MREMTDDSLKHQLADAASELDEQGKRFWRRHNGSRRSEYVAAIIVNFVLFYIANSLLAWNVPFLTASFVAPLVVINMSLTATVIVNVVWLAYDPAWFRHLGHLGLNALAFVATYTLLIVFPFAFVNPFWSNVAQLALFVALLGIGIAMVVEFVQLIFGLDRR
jgi:hypothetical protein